MTTHILRAITHICSICECSAADFLELYNNHNTVSTGSLAEQALATVTMCQKLLAGNGDRYYRLPELLRGMLIDAPHSNGKRFVSIAIKLAYDRGKIVPLALAWADKFLIPLLAAATSQ
ncbi:hypothetical protein D9613_009437 [Agrocybe pediades]|uniref:Uncharacterized protein n=1 Tax=Agrocybe pediades TaxID=84607 RepID=A0A8H4R5D8_9AGAR|nr:hypothetical protein D9613_009437 [Agrocybe pediades]